MAPPALAVARRAETLCEFDNDVCYHYTIQAFDS